MKKNIFAETYAQVQELKKAYDAAEDEAGREKARAGYNAPMESRGLGMPPAASGGNSRPPWRMGTPASISTR